MNLEELQIKIGIELKELNKQLKKASDDINKHIGPKATKKLMADNNKIVKDGFKDMEKTAKTSAKQMRKEVTKEFEAMSKDISKSLSKAFELDMRKFNSNLTQSMNDAKSTVRSACNDIRRELNAALNVKANIRVNASASASGSNTASRSSDAAAIMQSSQYTGAMIAKAVNEMIKVNNANTARLDASIRHIESALKSEFSKLGAKMQASNDKARVTGSKKDKSSTDHTLNIKADIETNVKVVEEGLQSEVDKAIKNLNVDDIKTSLVLDENIKEEVDKAINSVSTEDIKLKADLETNIKLNADELQNDANKAIREVTTRDIEASIKVDKGNLQDEVEDAIRDIDVPELSVIVELDEHLQNDINRAVREVNVRDLKVDIKLSENSQSELQSEVNNLITKITVPDLVASFKLDSSALQTNVNDIVNRIKVPKITVETEAIAPKDGNKIAGYLNEPQKALQSPQSTQGTIVGYPYGPDTERAAEALRDAVKVLNIFIRNLKSLNSLNSTKQLGAGSYGSNPIQGGVVNFEAIGSAKGSLKEVTELMKEIHRLSRMSLIDSANFDTIGEAKGELASVIELMKQIHSLRKAILPTTGFELGEEGELDTKQVDVLKQIHELKQKIKNTPLQLDAPEDKALTDRLNSLVNSFNHFQRQLVDLATKIDDTMNGIGSNRISESGALKVAKFLTSEFEALGKKLDELIPKFKKFENASAATQLRGRVSENLQDIKGLEEEIPSWLGSQKPQRPEKPEAVSIEVNDEATKKLESIKEQILEIQQEFDFIASEELPNFAIDENLFKEQFGSIEEYGSLLYDLYENLEKLDNERIKLNIDTEDARKQIKGLQEVIATYIDSISNGEFKDNIKAALGNAGVPQRTTSRPRRPSKGGPSKPTIMGNRSKHNSPPDDFLAITIDDEPDDVFDEFNNEINIGIANIKSKLGDLNKLYSSLFNRSFIGQTFKYDLNIVNKELDKAFEEVKKLKGEIERLSGSIGLTSSTERLNSSIQDKPQASIIMGDDEEFSEFGDKVSAEIKEIEKQLNHLRTMYSSLFGRSVIGQTFQGDLGIVNESLGKTYNKVENLKESMNELDNSMGFRNKFPQEQDPNSGLPMVIDNTIDDQFDGIRKDIEDAYDKLQAFNKAIADLFDYLKMPIGAKFSKSIGDVEELKSAISNLLGMNKFGPGLEGYKKQVEHDSEEIIKDINKIYQALQTPFGGTSASFKEVSMLRGIIKEITGMEPGVELINQKQIEETKQQLKDIFAEMAKMDNGALRDTIVKGTSYTFEEAAQRLEELKKQFEEAIESPGSSKEDIKFGKALIKDIEKVQKKVKELQDEDIELNAKVDAQLNAQAIRRGFSELYVKATMDAVKADKAVEVPVDFELVARGAKNLRDLFDLPEFKEHAEALRDILKGIDLGDDLKTNLDLDGLLKKLKGIQSIDDIDIDLSDLRTDLIKLAEEADKMRSATEDEIEIKVIDDEVAKITELLKLLDKLQAQSNVDINIDVNGQGPILGLPGSGSFSTRRRPGSGSFSTRPGGPVGSGGAGGGRYTRPGSGNFTFGGYVDDDIFGSSGSDPFDAHVVDHYRGIVIAKFKEIASKIKDIMGGISKSIKNGFKEGFKNVLKGTLSKMTSAFKSMWSKLAGIFKKGAKDCEKATNGLSLKLKDLLKTALSFGSLYGLINLGKQAIQQSGMLAQSEAKLASLMNKRMGATKETYQAIKALVSEQAKLGVVSEAAMTKGAEQLSMYVHSAKALETLIPAIANMTARRGGFNATENDAEEVATQLGEAIREGSITPLEQSGIYLSEAEIKKFQALRTEEERAAYLAQVVADNIGDINQNLAQTPHGQIAQLKNNFQALLGTLGTLLVNVIQPIVKWLNTIVVAANNALKALGHMLGFDMSGGGLTGIEMGTTAPGDSGIDDTKDSIDDTKDSLEEAEEAAEKFKGALMGFDEINILSNNSSKEDDPSDITPGEGGQLTPPSMEPPEFEEGENIFTKFGEKMKAFLDEFLEPFKAAWDLLGDDLKAEWADLIESFKHFCDSLGSFLKSVWDNGGKEFVQHMAEIALACAKAAMEIGGEILDSLARLWDHLDPSKNMHTQRLLDVLNEVSEKIRDFILGLGDHFESLMANGGQDVLNAMGDCFMDLGAAAVNGLGVAIDALDGLIDHLDPAVNENTRNMLQALADMFHAVGEAAWDFSELLRSALENGGQDMINAFGDMMMNLGETVARVITTMMESFSKFFEYIDPENNDITRAMMKAWEEAFLAIGDMALGFAELFESVMANGGQDVLNKLGDAFNSLVGLVGTCVKEIADAMNGLFEHLDPKTNEFTQNMLKAWEKAFESISGMAKDIGEVLGSVMDNGGQEVVNAIGDLGVKIVGAFGKVTGTVADCVGDLFKHLDPAENKIAKGALESFEYFINSIGDFVDSLADALGTFMDNGGQEFVNNMGDIIALIGDLAFTIGGDILNAISTFMDSWLGHAVISTCATALELVSEVLKGLLEILEPLSPIISGVVTAIGGFVVAQKVVGFIQGIVTAFQAISGAGGVLALAKGAFTALWGVLAANPIAATVAAIVGIGVAIVALYNKCEGFREFIDGILKGFQDLFNELKEHFSNLLEDVRNIFGNVIDIITGIFEGDGEKVGEAVRNLILNLVDLMMDMNKAFVEVGWALIKGLVQGIWECIKALPSLLAGFLEFVVDFFKGLFGIHSPSKVFAELGKNLIEGLVKGITDSIKLVTEAFKKIGDTILNTAKDIVKTVSDKFKETKEAIKEKLKETKEVVSEKWKEIKETVSDKAKESYEIAKENWNNLKETVSEKTKETYESIKENWKNVKDTAVEIFKGTYEVVKDNWTKIKDTVSDKAKDTYEIAKDKWANLKQVTSDRFKETYDTIKDKFTNIRETVKTKATQTFEDVSSTWTKVKDDAATKLEQIRTDAEKRYNDVKNTIVSKINEAKTGILEKWEEVRTKTNESIENVRKTAEDKYNNVKETIVKRLDEIKSTTGSKWEEIKKSTGDSVEKIRQEAETQYGKIKDSLVKTLENTKSAMATKWDSIKTDAISKVSAMAKEVSNKFAEIKTKLSSKLDEVKSTLSSKWESIKTQTSNAASKISTSAATAFDGISSKASKALDSAKKSIDSGLSSIGRLFKNTSWSLPKIKLPHFKISGSFSLNPPKVPSFSVEWYKRGGIIDGITPLGMTGGTMHMAGEAGKEMVVPLENTSFTTKIAKAMGQAVDNAMARNFNNSNGYNNNTDDNRDVVLQLDGREFARASINSINKLQRESGRTLLDI